jgi:predicted phage terminase large subunit-like protein
MRVNPEWSVCYRKAIEDDGTLLFPERLSYQFLESARRTMGPYLYSNQYLNVCIPDGLQTFKKHWRRYYAELPKNVLTFAFIDPAISEADTADYTGVVIVSVDTQQNWYVVNAFRRRMNPSQLIDLLFKIAESYKTQMIGVETVAFQKAIIHFAHEEMKRRNKHIPVTGVNLGTDKTKEMRILSLVPRFEMGTIMLAQGLADFEREYDTFPRGAHDDILDALASLDAIVTYPIERKVFREPTPADVDYEKWYIANKLGKGNPRE